MSDSLAFRRNEPFLGPFWWKKIFDDPPLRQQLNRRWAALRQGELATDRIMSLIDSLANVLGESQQRNFVRWPVLGQNIWPNVYVGKTYQDEIAYLKTWIVNRLGWMDRELAVTAVGSGGDAGNVPQLAELRQNFPNPFNPGTSIPYSVHQRGIIEMKVFDLLGREVALLVNDVLEPGEYAAIFDGSHLAGGTYVLRLLSTPLGPGNAGPSLRSRKMLLLR
jgi:hypothetical protein